MRKSIVSKYQYAPSGALGPGSHSSVASGLIFKSRSYERLGLDLFTAILAQFCRSIPEFNPNLISERLDLTRRTLSKGISTSL